MRGGVLPLTLARLPGACGSPPGAALPAPLGRAAWPALPGAAPPPFAPGAFPSAFFGSAITSSRSVEHLARPSGHPDLLAVRQGLHSDAGRLAAAGVHQHDVGEADRPLPLDDAALPDLLCGLLVLLAQFEAIHHYPALPGTHPHHLALLSAFRVRNHH